MKRKTHSSLSSIIERPYFPFNFLAVAIFIFSIWAPRPQGFFHIPSSVKNTTRPNSQAASASLELNSQVGGPTEALAIQGNYAYLGVGQRVVVVNISDPTAPFQVGASEPFPFFVEGIAVKGNQAFVAAGEAGLYILNISNPTNPVEVGSWDSPGYAEGVAAAGKYLYLADGPYGLRILDISVPAHPNPVSEAYSLNYGFDITLSGKYAFLSAGGAGLLVVDVSNPLYPVECGSVATPGYVRGTVAIGNLVYAADTWGGIRVIDVGEMAHLHEIGFFQTPGQAFGVAAAGNRLYVADAFGGLQILDISTPAHPASLGSYSIQQGHFGRVVVAGNMAYITDHNWGMRIIDISTPAAPTQMSLVNPFSMAQAVTVVGNYAYVVAGYFGLHVIDIANPAIPVDVGSYALDGYGKSIEAEGQYVYVMTSPGSFHVFDTSDPTHLVQTGVIAEVSGIHMDYEKGYVYIANEAGLRIIDVNDPANPHESGFLQIQEPPGPGRVSTTDGVAVRGNYAYVAASGGGLKVVDISDPSNPQLRATCMWTNAVLYDVALHGDFAYVVDWGTGSEAGLGIIDISDPLHPFHRSSFSLPASLATTSERVVEQYPNVFLADGIKGLDWVDVSNPDSPSLAGHMDTLGYVHDLFANSSQILVADDDGGTLIFTENPTGSAVSTIPMPISVDPTASKLGNAIVDRQALQIHSRLPLLSRQTNPTALSADTATTCTVKSTADSGPESLRDCLEAAHSNFTINFDPTVFPPSSPATILVQSDLPCLCWNYESLDASNAGVILDGSYPALSLWGLGIGASHDTIMGLQIVNFAYAGVTIGGYGSANRIGGDRNIGTGPIGQGNMIGGTRGPAAIMVGWSTNNIIQGNLVGVNASGTAAFPNNIGMMVGSPGNLIGGYQPGERNIVSGNFADGITLHGTAATGNLVVGNYAGLDINGNSAIPNGTSGIAMDIGAAHNRIENNVIVSGLLIYDSNSSYNTVVGNRIGTNASGTVALGSGYGVSIGGGAGYNRIGGKTSADKNIIVGGITLFHRPSIGNMILGNYIGTDLSGLHNLSEVGPGIGLTDTRYVFVGGSTPAERNLISGKSFGGIIVSPGARDIFIFGNDIGPDFSGAGTIENRYLGIWLNSSEHVYIQNNTIAYFDDVAVQVELTGSNIIRHNSIYNNNLEKPGQPAIQLLKGGNNNLAAPTLLLNTTGLIGTTCAFCTVELFSDASDEGRAYIGSAVADLSGEFSHPKVCQFPYPMITATATNPAGDTSAFSLPQTIPWDCSSPNPLPTLSDIGPTSITASSANYTFLLTLNGENFIPSSKVRWDNVELSTISTGATQITAIVPSGFIALEGIVNVSVYNPGPGGGTSNSEAFTILPPKRIYLPLVCK